MPDFHVQGQYSWSKGSFIYYVRKIFWRTNISQPPDTHKKY